ncbi:GH3 auxin-responsive promoter family protein [Alloiococcus sp. CFN-8]|uniref:GH3 auxin-responsive promoter family protein n=1 Tax=Alloiococcus sp. CFN-8 TaxID=3416081 RepID=UPI003CF1C6A3
MEITSLISKTLYLSLIKFGAIEEAAFERKLKNFNRNNIDTLQKIIERNKSSEYGLKHNFKNIKSIEEYKKQVPLGDYNDFYPYIERMAKGEKNILVSEPIEYFSHTSGTTGRQKLIPTTKSSRRNASKYMAVLVNRYAYKNFKENWSLNRGLMLADIVQSSYTEADIPIRSGTSGGFNSIKKIIPYLYTSPLEVMKISDKQTALYLHCLFALKDRSLSYISSVFISNILDFFRLMEKNKKELTKDIREGRINRALPLEEKVRKSLNTLLFPDASRGEEVSKEFDKGFNGIARRLWPKLSYLMAVTGANFSIYDSEVDYYTGSLPIYSPAYAASEALMGINKASRKISYIMIPDTAYYEFIPLENGKEGETVSSEDLILGKSYEVVITNHAGLYRYPMGDVVKVIDFYKDAPEIEFLYRKNQLLNMVAEKTTEEHITHAILETMNKLKVKLIDYTTSPDIAVSPGRYIFYLELDKPPEGKALKELDKLLDNELRTANPAYDRARKGNRLSCLKVQLLLPGTFNAIKEILYKKGVSKNQLKIPRVLNKNHQAMGIIKENIQR